MTDAEIKQSRELWEAFESVCSGLLASACKSHRPYMGCPLDCTDVENTIGDEWRALRPVVPALLAEVERLRGEADCVAERMLFCLSIYRGYRIESRGPAGCIFDALEAARPDLAKMLADGLADAHDLHELHFGDGEKR